MARSRDSIFVRGGSDVSFIDYPGRIAAIVFAAGCNFRCGYCHNPSLVRVPLTASFWRFNELLARVAELRGRVDGVVVTGGEPMIHPDMPGIISEFHALGLPVKLNTNGSMPDAVAESLAFISYISLDIKSSPAGYRRVSDMPDAAVRMHRTLEQLRASSVPWDIRITAAPGVLDEDDIPDLLPLLVGSRVYLQRFDPANTLDGAFASVIPYTQKTMERMRARIAAVASCEIV